MEAIVDGKVYTVEARDMTKTPLLFDDIRGKGFDGIIYYLTGKRGGVRMAYRSAKSGQFVIVA